MNRFRNSKMVLTFNGPHKIQNITPWLAKLSIIPPGLIQMRLLLDLLLLLLLLLLYVFNHVLTREPSCNARNKMELQERITSRKHLHGMFE